jgi:signal transduction histidine kinase
MTRHRPVGLVLGMLGVTALGIVTLVSARRSPSETLGGGASWALALQLLAGLGVLAAGVGVFLEQLPLPGTAGAVLFTAAMLGGMMTSVLAGAAALAALGGDSRRADGLVAGAAVVTTLLFGLLATLVFDPRASGCFVCSPNLLLIRGDAGLYDALVRDGLPVAAVACGTLAFLTLARAVRRGGLARSTTAPVVIGGAGVAALGTALFAHETGAGVPEIDSITRSLWLLQCAILAAVAGGVALATLRVRLLRDRIAAIVAGASPTAETLRETLAATLGDPLLEIVFPRASDDAVDADGREARPAHGDVAVTEVVRHGEVFAQLRHAVRLSQTPERVAQAALGAGLALEHAALHARLQAELTELAAARARIVDVGDAERRRLERNLHDGAQQRLIALSLTLQLTPGRDGALGQATDQLKHALENLRVIAHGIYPVSLTEAGLAGAVRELADTSRVPLRIETAPDRLLPPSVDAAFYRLVLDCVRLAERNGDGASVTVRIETEADPARVRIVAPGIELPFAAPALEHAADRLAALSGELATRAQGADLIIEASVPCGS